MADADQGERLDPWTGARWRQVGANGGFVVLQRTDVAAPEQGSLLPPEAPTKEVHGAFWERWDVA